MVEWESGEITYEPLALISKDDPITCAVYAKKHDLLDTTGWKHLKRYAKTSKRLIRAVKQSRIRQVRASARYQHGFQVPRDYNDAMRLDKENGNTVECRSCVVYAQDNISASLDYFVTTSPPYLHQFSTISGGIVS